MADFIPGLRLAKVTLNMNQFGSSRANTLWFQVGNGSSWDTTNLQAIATGIADWWVNTVSLLVHSSVTLVNVHARSWESSTSGQWFHSVNEVGQLGGSALPSNDSFAIAFKTASSGKNFAGRNFVVGLATTQQASDFLSGTVAANYVAAYELLPDVIAGVALGSVHVVASFVEEGVDRTAALITPITTYTYVNLAMDSQRKRLPGRGN